MRLGIDVGGTNTDAVLIEGDGVLCAHKTRTTRDVITGIKTAIREVIRRAQHNDPTPVSGKIQAVMIGTTHFTNAVVEGRGLASTAVLRLGLPATKAVPPLVDWPEELVKAISPYVQICHGGHEVDGRTIAPLVKAELDQMAEAVAERGIQALAITSVFSPVNAQFEEEAAAILRAQLPRVSISLSHEIGRIGLLERENATVLNAALRDLAEEIAGSLVAGLSNEGINAPIYLTQNDGTLISLDRVKAYPVLTFASGPTNSMRGAAFLSGLADCAVVDVGGTTTDVGILQRGFPRPAGTAVYIGGVRTNARMPDVVSLGLGGGSRVHRREGAVSIGPDSTGYEITSEARCFGGSTLTATDLAIAGGRGVIAESSPDLGLDRALVDAGLGFIDEAVARQIDRMKTSPEDIPVVAVGGGSIILADRLPGVAVIRRPSNYGVANAIGAAIAQVGGEVEQVHSLEKSSREVVLARVQADAAARAAEAGANPDSIEIVEMEEVPLSYLPSQAVRIRVKAVGDLRLEPAPGGVRAIR